MNTENQLSRWRLELVMCPACHTESLIPCWDKQESPPTAQPLTCPRAPRESPNTATGFPRTQLIQYVFIVTRSYSRATAFLKCPARSSAGKAVVDTVVRVTASQKIRVQILALLIKLCDLRFLTSQYLESSCCEMEILIVPACCGLNFIPPKLKSYLHPTQGLCMWPVFGNVIKIRSSFVEIWMDLETLTQSAVSQKEKIKCCLLMHICGIWRKQYGWSYLQAEIETQV